MYPDTSPTTPVDVAHGHTLPTDDQAAARPCRSATRPGGATSPKTVGYARTRRDPADLRMAVIELHQLGVNSEHIYLDRAGELNSDGLQLALKILKAGDTLAVARLTRLGRSLASLTRLVNQLADLDVRLAVADEMFDSMSPARLLQLLTEFQVQLVDQAIEDADWMHERRTDMRHPFHRVDAVQAVWLHQLYDAGMPRFQLGQHFGVSRATVFRIAADTLSP